VPEEARPAVLVAAGVTGLVAAACVPLDRPGIGWVGAGLAVAGALAAVARPESSPTRPGSATDQPVMVPPGPTAAEPAYAASPSAPPRGVAAHSTDEADEHAEPARSAEAAQHASEWARPTGEPAQRLTWAAAALALLAVGTFRAAEWLFVLCVLTAGGAAALALTGGSWSLKGLPRALPWAGRGLAARYGAMPAPRILAVGGLSAGLLVVFGALFASADAAFADLLGAATPRADTGDVAQRLFLFACGAAGVIGGAYLLMAGSPASPDKKAPRRVRRWDWAVPVAALDLLFAAFVLVQLTVLFGGAHHVLREEGPSYAQYARSGFWQLLAVTVLTLAVVAVAATKAPRDSRADRVLMRGLLGALAALTMVIVASALYRMNLYEQAYGFTRLRLLVSACELWLGLVFAMLLAAGVRLRATWLAQAIAGSGVAALIGLALLNPDRFIADRNVDRYAGTGRIDVSYLSGLSADAVPALDRLPGQLRECALSGIAAELARSPDDWRGANLARARARDILGGRLTSAPDPRDCPHGP
jgi:hypothetical protein